VKAKRKMSQLKTRNNTATRLTTSVDISRHRREYHGRTTNDPPIKYQRVQFLLYIRPLFWRILPLLWVHQHINIQSPDVASTMIYRSNDQSYLMTLLISLKSPQQVFAGCEAAGCIIHD
ncbi:MAG: hypothetical protein ACI90V_007806, partial [Bacillariaceae sp.]|jgi:hypothetical protein